MKRETLHLPKGMSVATGRDFNGRYFVAYARDTSVFLRSAQEVRRFLRLPASTPSRASLDSWFESLAAGDSSSELSPDLA
jgi:hypothetical protein